MVWNLLNNFLMILSMRQSDDYYKHLKPIPQKSSLLCEIIFLNWKL